MIIWISGAYGVGKSALADALAAKMENAMVFDAEEVGNAVRGNYPGEPYGMIFEDYPLWREFCYLLLRDIHEKFRQDILVPMTMLRQSTCSDILGRLNADGTDTRLIILEATRQTIRDRILARGEDEDCWCMRNIDMARAGSMAVTGGYHIATDGKTVDELADIALDYIRNAR